MNRPAVQVVRLVQPADLGQADYYKTLLDECRARVDTELADHYVALAKSQENGDAQRMHRLHQMIRDKRREQFKLDCLLDALQHRFFPRPVTKAKPSRSFDIEITRDRRWWMIHIPEINGVTKTRQRDDAEVLARELIAIDTNTPIADVTVRVITD
jgi:hypothetical protein